jgi:hypothetical protein
VIPLRGPGLTRAFSFFRSTDGPRTRGGRPPPPLWPLLPLVKRDPPGVETLGVLVDVKGFFGRDEYPWHVFLDNVLLIPMTLSELASSPGESFPSAEELFASGWRVD